MSRLVYFDCASGAAGDMLLGALLDLGLPMDVLRGELAKLPLEGYRLESRRVHRAGLHATKLDVVLEPADQPHSHRGLRQILELLERSTLEPLVKDRAALLFHRLAAAEAAVHGTTPEEVRFHEVGALDSILDVVGGVVGLAWLRADRFVASPLNLGTGTVSFAHGVVAVPAPATARLVEGVPVYGAGEGELLTPTGALLVTGHASSYGPLPLMRPQAVGQGAGSRDTAGRPNLLRLIVGEEGVGAPEGDVVVVLESLTDDMLPQLCRPVMERLFAAGALDVYYTPVQAKKGRPGLLVTVVGPPERREALEEVLFAETTTLGIRRQEWQRSVLARDLLTVTTAYGPVRVKVGRRGDRVYNAMPEFDDCQGAATTRGVPVKEVWAAALAAFRSGDR